MVLCVRWYYDHNMEQDPIEAILGAGSFGVVYRAFDTCSGAYRGYAVKRIEKTHYISRQTEHHKRVSYLPSRDRAGRYVFFVYDLCSGGLHSVIGRLTFFRDDELIKSVFVQIINALDLCHPHGSITGT